MFIKYVVRIILWIYYVSIQLYRIDFRKPKVTLWGQFYIVIKYDGVFYILKSKVQNLRDYAKKKLC